jgi:HTH-type transcriptional regulator / antitoxin HigA
VGNLRTLNEFTEQYFRDHPEEIDDYLTEIFQDYAVDNDSGVLLASLRILARVRGVRIMKALGDCLLPPKATPELP